MRRKLSRLFFFVFFIIALCLIYGFFIEPNFLKTRHVEIISPNYNSKPLRIGLLTDIHIGSPHVPPERVDEIVERMNAAKPDIILVTGDYIGGHLARSERVAAFNQEIDTGIDKLSGLSAPMGVYSTLGNHDRWYDISYVQTQLERAGIQVLENRAVMIGETLCLIGLSDFDTGQADPSVFGGCGPESDIIAIMHSPDSFRYFRSDVDLGLAGNTHGGQINIPIIGRRVTSTEAGQDYAYGRTVYKGIPVFISAGIGTSILPARFRAPPEIVIISLSK